ncbi:hypothetical protein [Blastomonas sp. AAP25]|uniref:hypothetical protein n=1 Tax=Blastomonas sp. AAP25 TaxID=1523416 RepID=UPI000A5BF1A6|nr:hypothetical protein [Blastomonas sp. AAP25]
MARKHKSSAPNQTGRNKTRRFALLPHSLLMTNAYRSLNPNDRSLLVELTMMENGSNNGSLYLSVRDAADRMGIADLKAASRSFDALTELGFIEMTQASWFRVKAAEHSRARCWRLTWLTGPGRKAASCAFERREPEPKTRAYKRMERGQLALNAYRKAKTAGRLPVVDTDTMTGIAPEMPVPAVVDSNTLNAGNGGKLPNWLMADSMAHTAVTMGNVLERRLAGWFEPDWSLPIACFAFAASLASHQRKIAA